MAEELPNSPGLPLRRFPPQDGACQTCRTPLWLPQAIELPSEENHTPMYPVPWPSSVNKSLPAFGVPQLHGLLIAAPTATRLPSAEKAGVCPFEKAAQGRHRLPGRGIPNLPNPRLLATANSVPSGE